MAEPRIMSLGRPDRCVGCGSELDAGVRAEWNPSLRAVTCIACVEARPTGALPRSSGEQVPSSAFERGSPGASARRRYERLHDRREEHARQKLGRRLGGVYVALSKE